MFNSTVLEVALGLVLIYFVFSTLCSAIQEGIAAWMGLRARELEKALLELLGPTYLRELYEHPLISGLMRPATPPPPAAPAGAAPLAQPIAPEQRPHAIRVARTPQRARPQYIEPKTFSRALVDVLTGDQPPTFVALAQAVQSNPTGVNQAVGALMGGLTAVAGENVTRDVLADAERLREVKLNIENWYNDAMERLSGQYKRYAQLMILVIALLVCGIANVDTIAITNSLASNATLRASVVAFAEHEARGGKAGQAPPASVDQVAREIDSLKQLQFPLGWPWAGALSPDLGLWVRKIVGLLISTVALTLGAPFWFDVLNRLVNVRTAGNRPDTDQKNHLPTFTQSA